LVGLNAEGSGMVVGRIRSESESSDLELTSSMSRGRVIVVRVLGALAMVIVCFLPVFAALDAYSLVGEDHVLEPPGSPEAEYGAAHPSEAVHIPAFTAMAIVAATGLLGLIVNPRRAGSATHVLAVGTAMLLAAPIVGDPDNYGGQGLFVDPLVAAVAVPALAVAVVAAPWREWSRGGLRRPTLLWLAVLASPLLWFGIDQALLQRNTWPPLADPHHQTHWMVMAQLALAVPLVTAGAALSGRGWRAAGAVAALGVLAMAIPSFFDPEAASTLPLWSAVLGTLWAGAVVSFTWRESGST
jgi:hypothetical protein